MRVLTLSRNKTHDKLLRKCHFSNLHAKEPAQGIPCAGSFACKFEKWHFLSSLSCVLLRLSVNTRTYSYPRFSLFIQLILQNIPQNILRL